MKKTILFSFSNRLMLFCSVLLLLHSNVKAQNACNPNFTTQKNASLGNKARNFTSANNDSTVQHFWSFGDGTISTNKSPTKVYANFGSYYVCHMVSKPNVCVDTFCTTITIMPDTTCTANFTYYKDTITNAFHFINTSTGTNLTYQWTFGDNTGSSLANPTKNYTTSDTFYVCLTVRSLLDSNCFNTKCIWVYNAMNTGACKANFTFTKSSTNKKRVFFTNTSTGSNLIYSWNFGDSSFSSATNPTKNYTRSGTYNVCLTVTSSTNTSCYNKKCRLVNIASDTITNCKAEFIYQLSATNTTRVGALFTSTGTPSSNYSWDFGDSTFKGSGKQYYHQFPKPGNYYVCLTISDSNCTNTICKWMNVSIDSISPCSASYMVYRDSINGALRFDNTSLGNNLTYLWAFGDGSTSSLAYPTKTYSQSGVYKVCLQISNSKDSCFDTYCDSILFTKNGTSIKENDAISITQLYPMPISDELNIDFFSNDAEAIDIVILDMTGKTCKTKTFNSKTGENNIKIDMNDLIAGMYMVQLKSEKGTISRKVIK